MFAAGAPTYLHAQTTTDPGQQGDFQGENTDTGAAAVDNPNEKEGTELPEASETAPAAAHALAAPASVASAPEAPEPPDSGADTDRVEDQVGDQLGSDTPNQ